MPKFCLKITFKSRKEALDIINQNPRGKSRFETYKCDQCGFWHVGHPQKKQMRLIRYGNGQSKKNHKKHLKNFRIEKFERPEPIGTLGELVDIK